MEPVLTEKEVAQYFKLKEATIQQWRYKNKGPRYFKDGGLIRYRASDVEKYLEKQIVDPEQK